MSGWMGEGWVIRSAMGADLCVVGKNLLSMLASNATQLVAAERHSSIKLVPGVHPHSAGL